MIATNFPTLFSSRAPKINWDSLVPDWKWDWSYAYEGNPSFRCDIIDCGENYEITADMPGIEREDISVTLENHTLTISASRDEHTEDKDSQYHVKERRLGSFQRSFHISERTDDSKVQASLNNGVLTVTIPKAQEVLPKRIEIH